MDGCGAESHVALIPRCVSIKPGFRHAGRHQGRARAPSVHVAQTLASLSRGARGACGLVCTPPTRVTQTAAGPCSQFLPVASPASRDRRGCVPLGVGLVREAGVRSSQENKPLKCMNPTTSCSNIYPRFVRMVSEPLEPANFFQIRFRRYFVY